MNKKYGSTKLVITLIISFLLISTGILTSMYYINRDNKENVEQNALIKDNAINKNDEDINIYVDNSNLDKEDNNEIKEENETNNEVNNNYDNSNKANNIIKTEEVEYIQKRWVEEIKKISFDSLNVSWVPYKLETFEYDDDFKLYSPNLYIEKMVNKDRVNVEKDSLTYIVKIKNNGNLSAENVTVTDYISKLFETVENISNNGVMKENVVTWNISKIKPNEVITVSFDAKFKEISDDEFSLMLKDKNCIVTNIAKAKGDNTKEVITNEVVTSLEKAVITSSKTAGKDKVTIGDIVTYTITAKNSGNASKNVVIEDVIPEGTTLVSADKNPSNVNSKLTWNLEVAANSEEKVSFVVKINKNIATGTIKNIAIVDGEKTNETVTPIITFNKKVDKIGNVESRDILTYTITVINLGSVEVKDITVLDKVPNGTTLVEGQNLNVDEKGNITWNIDKISKESHKEITFKVRVNDNLQAGTLIENIAKVNNFDTNKVTNKVITSVISGNKTADKNHVSVGGVVTYTITAVNSGEAYAKNVSISDTIPNGTTLIEDSISDNGVYDKNSGKITWNVDIASSLVANNKKSVSFKVIVQDTKNNKIENVARVNNEDTNKVELPVISYIKFSSIKEGSYVHKDDIITYTIRVTNTSNVKAENVVITDTVPNGAELVLNQDLNVKNNVITWNIDVDANSYKDVTFKVKVKDLNNTDKISNTATVDSKDTNTVINEYAEAVITSNKSADKDVVVRGDKVTYTITAKNSGNASKDIIIEDIIPEGTTLIYSTGFPTHLGNKLTWNVLVPANSDLNVTFTVKINNDYSGTISNIANVDNGSTNEVKNPLIIYNKTIDKSGDVKSCDILTYNINVTNTSDVIAKDVKITDSIPNGTEYYSVQNANPVLENGAITGIEKTVSIKPHETYTVVLKVKVLDTLNNTDKISNIAYVNGNKVSSDDVRYVKPILNISKLSNGKESNINVIPGSEITYTIKVTNSGDLAASSVRVIDSIPDGITVNTSSISDNGIYEDNKITWTVNVKEKGEKIVSFKATVNDVLDGTVIKNIANIDKTNLTDTTTDTIKHEVKTAEVTEKSETIKKKNIVLVLDLSSSMSEYSGNITKLNSAKTAAKNFIDNVYKNGDISGVNIEVITFNNRNKIVSDSETVDYSGTNNLTFENGRITSSSMADAEKLKNAIDNIYIPHSYINSGFGTHIYAALEKANERISALKSFYPNNDNVVIFLGDGEPTDSDNSGFKDNTNKNIISEASKIKTKAKIYTIGFAMSDKGKILMENIATSPIDSSEKYAYTASNQDSLLNAFNAISTSEGKRIFNKNSVNGIMNIDLQNDIMIDISHPVKITINGNVYKYTSILELNNLGYISYSNKTITWNVKQYNKNDILKLEYFTK